MSMSGMVRETKWLRIVHLGEGATHGWGIGYYERCLGWLLTLFLGRWAIRVKGKGLRRSLRPRDQDRE